MIVHQATVHEGRREWLCAEAGCGSAFGRSWHLSDHRQTVHEGRRGFLCGVPGCGSTFGRKGHLLAHRQSVHEGRRDWKCDAHCGRVFKARRSLLRHKRSSSCQAVARSRQQGTTLPPRKQIRDDIDTHAPNPDTPAGHESGRGGGGTQLLSGPHSSQRRPPTELTPRSQKTSPEGSVGGPHPISSRRKVLFGGSKAAAATRVDVHINSSPVNDRRDVSRALSAFNSPTADIALPKLRDHCVSLIAQGNSIYCNSPVLDAGAPASHMGIPNMSGQEGPVHITSRAFEMPKIFSHSFTQTPPAHLPQSGVCPLQGTANTNSRLSAPTGGKCSDEGVRHGDKTNLGGRGGDAELSVAPEEIRDVGRRLMHASGYVIGTGRERIWGRGGHYSGAQRHHNRSRRGGSHSQGQDGSLQHGDNRGDSGSELSGVEGQYAPQGMFCRGVNYNGSCWSDGVRNRPQAGIGSRADAFRQKNELQTHLYDHVGEFQNGRSLGLIDNRLDCCQQASAKERMSGSGTPACGDDLLSASNYGNTCTVVPAHPPIPNFSTAFRPILLNITRTQRSVPNSI